MRAAGAVEDQDLVGVGFVLAEAGDVEPAVWAEDKTLGTVELVRAATVRTVALTMNALMKSPVVGSKCSTCPP